MIVKSRDAGVKNPMEYKHLIRSKSPIKIEAAYNELFDLIPLPRLDHDKFDSVMEKNLFPKQTVVLRMRFGLDDGIQRAEKEIAERLSCSYQRVSQIQSSAIHRLRKHYSLPKIRRW